MYHAKYVVRIDNGATENSSLDAFFRYDEYEISRKVDRDRILSEKQHALIRKVMHEYLTSQTGGNYRLSSKSPGYYDDFGCLGTTDLYGREKITDKIDILQLGIHFSEVPKFKLEINSDNVPSLEEIANLKEIDNLVHSALKKQWPSLNVSAEAKK